MVEGHGVRQCWGRWAAEAEEWFISPRRLPNHEHNSCTQTLNLHFIMVILRSEISVSVVEPDVFAFPAADIFESFCVGLYTALRSVAIVTRACSQASGYDVLAVGGCADLRPCARTSGHAETQP